MAAPQSTRDARAALEGMPDDQSATIVTYWDDEHYGVALSKMQTSGVGPAQIWSWLVKPHKHEYGGLPWVIWHGHRLPFNDVGERIGISVLYSVQALLQYLTVLLSQKATIISKYADPDKVLQTQNQGQEWPSNGGLLKLEPEDKAYYLEHKGNHPDVDAQIQQVLDMIEDATLPRHMYGAYVGLLSGVSMSLLRTPVLMKIAFMQEDIERALIRLNEMMLRIIDNKVTKPIEVYGRAKMADKQVVISPDTVQGSYRNSVKLSTSLPTDEPQIVGMLGTLMQTDLLSPETARDVIQQTLGELVGHDLGEEEEKVFINKFLLQNPAIGNALAMVAAKAAGLDIEELMQPQQQPQQPGRQGMPLQGADAGLPAQSPLNALETTEPDGAEMARRTFQQQAGQQGGAPITATGMGQVPTKDIR